MIGIDVEEDAAEPLGNVEEESVLLRLGMGFAEPVETDADASPGPEAEAEVGFEPEFFLADANSCSKYFTAFSISSFFDRSTVSVAPAVQLLWM